MIYPDAATKTDPQCKFLSLCSAQLNCSHVPGANITPLAIAIVEMNVGIIAASLIVMHPCLKAIHNATLKQYTLRFSFSRGTSQSTSSRIAGLQRDKGIVRTTDLELESRSVSTREVTPKDLL